MPTICNIPVTLSIEEVLRRQEIQDSSRLKPRIAALSEEMLNSAYGLLEPAIIYETYAVIEIGQERLCLQNGAVLHGSMPATLLSSARELVVVICTIGQRLEEQAARYFERKEPLKGMLLDGIGSAAVDALGREACQLIRNEASARGLEASSPLSPGMHGWLIEEQRHLFELVPAEQIGVHLTEGGMMVPRKSVSMIIGLGSGMPTWKQAEVCARCNMKATCRHKVKA